MSAPVASEPDPRPVAPLGAAPQPRIHDSGARRDLSCCDCKYGVVVVVAPDRCPMCGGTVWELTAPARTLSVHGRSRPALPR